jgi:hypothetical protein
MIILAVLSGLICSLFALKWRRQAAWMIILPVPLGLIGILGWWIESRNLLCLGQSELCGITRLHMIELTEAAPFLLYISLGHIAAGTLFYIILCQLDRLMKAIDRKLAPPRRIVRRRHPPPPQELELL